jgi:two-component system phosphate regulon sensor histidine kinase PhoR
LLVARDISQLMRLEQVRRDFVANVSHELRTPLTVVHGYLDMIEPEQMPEFEPILHELRNQAHGADRRRPAHAVAPGSARRTAEERIGMRALVEALRREAVALSQGRHEITAHADPATCRVRRRNCTAHSPISSATRCATRPPVAASKCAGHAVRAKAVSP